MIEMRYILTVTEENRGLVYTILRLDGYEPKIVGSTILIEVMHADDFHFVVDTLLLEEKIEEYSVRLIKEQ